MEEQPGDGDGDRFADLTPLTHTPHLTSPAATPRDESPEHSTQQLPPGRHRLDTGPPSHRRWRFVVAGAAVLAVLGGVGAGTGIATSAVGWFTASSSGDDDVATGGATSRESADRADRSNDRLHGTPTTSPPAAPRASAPRASAPRYVAPPPNNSSTPSPKNTTPSPGGNTASPGAGSVPAACKGYTGNRQIGCTLLLQAGYTIDQMSCLDRLWTKESGWNPRARNPSSGAYGIPQSLPANKMATSGSDWRTNPATQIKWGLDYIKDRYGNPCAAWNHSQRTNWY